MYHTRKLYRNRRESASGRVQTAVVAVVGSVTIVLNAVNNSDSAFSSVYLTTDAKSPAPIEQDRPEKMELERPTGAFFGRRAAMRIGSGASPSFLS
ncbi:MAG: hypothetical protein IJH67_15390 [Thermoguttaceae bacterium]|nr:hypothetical protein [Thermoguttaceae bacterium]